jgi:hypothetical protein
MRYLTLLATASSAVLGLAFIGQAALGDTATGTFAQAGQGGCPAVPAIHVAFPFLLTDGTVLIQDQTGQFQNWWRLTPDNTGSYLCGTWTQLASIPNSFGYGPRFFAAAVLPDGRFAIAGGEYNLGLNQVNINKAALYVPNTNQWLPVRPPQGWTTIGDAQGAVLPNGQWMIADSQSKKQAAFNANNQTWTPTGSNFAPGTNDEAGWTLLPDGSIFSTSNNIVAPGGAQNGQRWVSGNLPNSGPPGTNGTPIGTWYPAATTATQQLYDQQQEMGPQVLLPDGTVLAIGATGVVSIYTPPPTTSPASTLPGSWANTTGLPTAPNGCGAGNNLQCGDNDAPAVLLPSGNVLTFAGPAGDGTAANEFRNGSHFFEFDRTANPLVWRQVAEPAGLATQISTDASFAGSLLMLPNGQVLFTDGINVTTGRAGNGVWTYTPNGTPNPAWQPTITAFPTVITRNTTYNIFGTLFNGMSQTNYYGDDMQNASNYPIVQVTMNAAPNHVYYGRTHDHSAMGVAQTTLPVSTKFELWSCPHLVGNPNDPTNLPRDLGAACVAETGPATLRVIANGIPSAPVNVTIN